MKKLFPVFILFTAMLLLFTPTIYAERTLPLVVDNADILTGWEKASLCDTLELLSESRSIEIAVVTVNSTNGKNITDYADDFYDYNGYGYGENDDGVLLLIDMGGREWWITTHGLGMSYLNDHALYMIEEAFIDMLSSGDYYGAFLAYANACDKYIGYALSSGTDYENGYYDDYYDDFYYPDGYYNEESEGTDIFSRILLSVVAGFIVSFIMVSSMKKGMTTVSAAKNASSYVVGNSLNLRAQSDHYLYSNTVRTPRNTDSSSSGGRSYGGSSSHRSSSGRSHGGRGGRF